MRTILTKYIVILIVPFQLFVASGAAFPNSTALSENFVLNSGSGNDINVGSDSMIVIRQSVSFETSSNAIIVHLPNPLQTNSMVIVVLMSDGETIGGGLSAIVDASNVNTFYAEFVGAENTHSVNMTLLGASHENIHHSISNDISIGNQGASYLIGFVLEVTGLDSNPIDVNVTHWGDAGVKNFNLNPRSVAASQPYELQMAVIGFDGDPGAMSGNDITEYKTVGNGTTGFYVTTELKTVTSTGIPYGNNVIANSVNWQGFVVTFKAAVPFSINNKK